MKLRGLLATLVGISSLWLSATPARAAAGAITIKGSDTMVILGQRWAEDYMKKNPNTVIQVTGGGSGTGISALINGTTDICASSRAMKPAGEGEAARPLQQHRRRDPGGARRPRGLRERVQPAHGDLHAGSEGDLHGQDHQLEAARRPGQQHHRLLAREQLGHVRVLQGASARRRRLHAARADHARHRGGRERGVQGEVRHRLRRRRVRQGDQDPQGEEGRDQHRPSTPKRRPCSTERTRWRARCSSTCATSRPARSSRSSTGCCRPTARGSWRRSATTR